MRAGVLISILVASSVAHAQSGEAYPPPPITAPPPAPPPPPLVDAPAQPPMWQPTRPAKTPPIANVSLSLGAGYRSLYDISYGVAVAQLLAGAVWRHFGFFGEVDIEAGAVMPRLPIEHLRVGLLLEGVFGRVRFGGGARIGLILIQRATSGATADGMTINVHSVVSVDLVQRGKRAFWIGLDAGAEFLAFSVSSFLGISGDIAPMATLNVGARF